MIPQMPVCNLEMKLKIKRKFSSNHCNSLLNENKTTMDGNNIKKTNYKLTKQKVEKTFFWEKKHSEEKQRTETDKLKNYVMLCFYNLYIYLFISAPLFLCGFISCLNDYFRSNQMHISLNSFI